MTTEKNKETIARLFEELLNRRDFTHLSELIGSEFKRHDIGRLFPDRFGTEDTRDHVSRLLTGIPDLRAEILDLFAEGDRVCMRYVVRGTHTGELLGKPGTGNPVRWEGVNIYRMVDGKAVESWQLADALSLLRQIGLLPPE